MDTAQVCHTERGCFALPQCERLAKRNDIGRLFAHGEAFLVYPIKCTYQFRPATPAEPVSRVMVMAPKRNHKRAVARNLLKRRMREAYRLQKQMLPVLFSENRVVDIALSYIAKGEPLDYRVIEKAVTSILEKLCTISENETEPITPITIPAADGGSSAER